MTPNPTPGRPRHNDILTPAEWRVINAVRHGQTNPQIAERLGVGLDAVKFHVANALSKLGFTTRAELRRWNGVSKYSKLYSSKGSADVTEKIGKIGQIARNVSDIDAATNWYRDTLGLPHLYTFGQLSFFDCDGTRLFLSEGDGEANSNSVIYFKVENILAAYDQLASKGVEFSHAPHKIHEHDDGTEEWMAFFSDPDGQPIGLMGTTSPA